MDPAAYRRALGGFATGVCVVTAHTPQGALGITVNSFTSVSLEPPLVLWCLDENSERWRAFAGVERFAIHVLAAEDRAMSDRFAWGVCALSDEEFDRHSEEPPRLRSALVRLDCTTHQRIEMGDHMVIVGAVRAFESREGDALTFYRGRYGRIGTEGS
ncbi:MAG: flavin reductase family protein [Brevundimonas sp.]|uniref:flavin reductase family protein n=1 Tax=Brevundimonas sp. TaxID=1871086 RepID=UPI00391D1C7B